MSKGNSIQFACWSDDEWSKFIRDYILSIHIDAQKLLNFYSYLNKFNNQPMDDVLKEWAEAKKALLGGIELNDKVYSDIVYNERALATRYKYLLGFHTNIREYFSYIVQKLEPKNLCSTINTITIEFIKLIHNFTSRIIDVAVRGGLIKQPEVNASIDDLIKKPESIVNLLYEFFNKCINITVSYNNYTTFAWSIRTITKRYLYSLYPELKDNKKLEEVKRILGLTTIFKPEVENEELRENYEVLAFPDYNTPALSIYNNCRSWGSDLESDLKYIDREFELYKEVYNYTREHSLGGLLCYLNEIIWLAFRRILSLWLIYNPVPDLMSEYSKRVNEELKRQWSPTQITNVIITNYTSYDDGALTRRDIKEFLISGAIIKSVIITGYRSSYTRDLHAPLSMVLDDLIPAVSLGKYNIIFTAKDRFSIYPNWGEYVS